MNEETQQSYIPVLRALRDILDTLDVPWWLDAGTLLCLYRDGDLLHEHDIDIGVFAKDFGTIRAHEQLFRDAGLRNFTAFSGLPIYHQFQPCGQLVYYHEFSTSYACNGNLLYFSVPKWLLKDFSHFTPRLLGFDVSVPAKTTEYLEWFFGPRWRIPLTPFEYTRLQHDQAAGIEPLFPVNQPPPDAKAWQDRARKFNIW